jgi:hypothetical protein
VMPLWLKNVSRIDALLFIYFLALLIHALLERELRRAMIPAKIPFLPLYPEQRECRAPSTERVLELFEPLQHHRLCHHGQVLPTDDPELTPLQDQIRRLLGLPPSAFRSTT